MHIIVSESEQNGSGMLFYNGKSYPCALGPAGLTKNKQEGDGATPIGDFALKEVFYRADRIPKPETDLPIRVIEENDGWCDDPAHPAYNRHVTLPFDGSHEKMWREDHAYDICVVLDYNLNPAIPGKGSAIFFHLAKQHEEGDGFKPTEGCVAVMKGVMRAILRKATRATIMQITPQPKN